MESEMNVDEDLAGELEDGELVEEQEYTPGFVTVTDEERKILRAKRFGISDEIKKNLNCDDPEILKIYKRMGVNSNTRIESLHLHNTQNLTTDDVVIYFNELPPLSIEWISGTSCNATWLDPITCANALKKYSIHIIGQTADEDPVSDDDTVHVNDIRTALPPGIWRKGVRFSLAPNLILRFANFFDKKNEKIEFKRNNFVFADEGDERDKNTKQIVSGNPWSDIAWKWGKNEQKLDAAKKFIPEIKEKITDAREILSKRLNKKSDTEQDDDNLAGRMRADEVEFMNKKKYNPRFGQIDLRNKIERKRKNIELPRYNKIDDVLMSAKRLLRSEKKNSSESESDENSDSSDKRSHSHHRHHKSSRSKDKHKCKIHHSKSKTKTKFFVPSPLRIEIDNDVYFEIKDEPVEN